MSTIDINSGDDPRGFSEFSLLRSEIEKFSHPECPEVDWPGAEKLCLALFERNGVELQTAAWYTLIRLHLARIEGLNEGLAVLETLIAHQWSALWPRQVHARVEILIGLSRRLQQMLETLTCTSGDLPALYQAMQRLSCLEKGLVSQGLRPLCQIATLRERIQHAATRLENCHHDDVLQPQIPSAAATPASAVVAAADAMPDVSAGQTSYRACMAESSSVCALPLISAPAAPLKTPRAPVKAWQLFVAGMAAMLVIIAVVAAGWWLLLRPEPRTPQLPALPKQMTTPLSAEEVQVLWRTSPPVHEFIRQTQGQLDQLSVLPPDWSVRYAMRLVEQVQALWPQEAEVRLLAQQWRRQLNASATPVKELAAWYQGMQQLQQLATRVSRLTDRPGNELMASELRATLFTIQQSLTTVVPLEELLRQLEQAPVGQPLPPEQQRLAEARLRQLIARYSLLQQRNTDAGLAMEAQAGSD
ncbi:VasL domain-containing protein [Entomohabitans teleogrylli]|uniref:VasL domain-containing protein n=1 Tax=Entomohabitans teleogrylli TaxID=1384589 RepID=UPI00073D8A62|nr:VasL domain-containing protein [Entomohabitans teleogrylli]